MPKNKQLPPFWTRPAVEVHLKETIERYGTKVVLGEPAWMQMAHEVHRLCPTDARPTPDFARQSGTNSVPEWQTPPERGSFIEEDFEFREGRPCLVDSAAVSVQQDLNGLGPENGDISPGNSGEQRHSTPLIRKAVLGIFEVDFEVDDLPEWAAADQRRAHLCQFAYALRAFDYLMHKTFGPDYMNGVDLGESPAILRAMSEAFKGLDFTSDDAIAEDLLTVGNVGLPRHGSELQRSRPPHRLADCGITVMVELTEEIQKQLVDAPVVADRTATASKKVTIFHDLFATIPKLYCNGDDFDLTPQGARILFLLLNSRDQDDLVSYDTILENWPARRTKDGKPAKTSSKPRNKIHVFCKEFNDGFTEAFGIHCKALTPRRDVGVVLNTNDLIWRPHKSRDRQKEAAIEKAVKAIGGKRSGVIEQGDHPLTQFAEGLDKDQFEEFTELLTTAQPIEDFVDKTNRTRARPKNS